jgi:NAD(P)-dependent dehydrogenase (short-subunit alcohol dehydrogenase family)
MKLKDKAAIVTGGSRGIGRAICLALAREGADVLLSCDRDMAGAQAVAGEIRALGRRATAIQADVSRCADVERMVQQAWEDLTQVDILVNNAGIFIGSPIEKAHEEDWDRVMAVNVKGVFLCCQAVGQRWIQGGAKGTIVNIASIAGQMPEVNGAAYSPSKAAVLVLTRLLAVEWAKYSIRVNSLSPGPVMTPLQHAAYPTPELLAARNRAIPMNRHGTPEEIARLAVFLVSDDAAYITGADFAADGGSLVSMYHLVHELSRKA